MYQIVIFVLQFPFMKHRKKLLFKIISYSSIYFEMFYAMICLSFQTLLKHPQYLHDTIIYIYLLFIYFIVTYYLLSCIIYLFLIINFIYYYLYLFIFTILIIFKCIIYAIITTRHQYFKSIWQGHCSKNVVVLRGYNETAGYVGQRNFNKNQYKDIAINIRPF